MKTWLFILSVLSSVMLAGCSRKTVHFEGKTAEQVQIAYEHIFHPPPVPKQHPKKGGKTGWFDFDFDLDFSGLGKQFADLDRTLRLLGIWSSFSEKRWHDGRYERSDATWWLIFPVRVKSETATVTQAKIGADLTLELCPADDALLDKRLGQVRKNLNGSPGP